LILDEVRLAHDLRRHVWSVWGEQAVPWLVITPEGASVLVRAPEGVEYEVAIRRVGKRT
jgi:hypothetical protein